MDNKKIRILMVLGSTEMGGAQAFILNVLRNIDRNRFHIDLAINSYAERNGIEDECRQLGCCFHIVPYFKVYNYLEVCKAWNKLLREHHYDIVYAHSTNSASVYLKIAKRHGCKTIAHCHSAGFRGGKAERVAKYLFTRNIGRVADYWFACSDKAAEHLYGSSYKQYPQYYNIPNAINVADYLYDENKRYEIRRKIGVADDNFVCGHVGSFSAPKNHAFLLEIFAEVVKREPKARLLCCGAGVLMDSVKEKAANLGILDKIVFAGVVKASDYLMAMDVFVFPSLFEGFPISILEAEATGLPIVMSDVITKEVDLMDLIVRKSLSDDVASWAEAVLKNKCGERAAYNASIARSKYNMQTTVKDLEKLYVELVNS